MRKSANSNAGRTYYSNRLKTRSRVFVSPATPARRPSVNKNGNKPEKLNKIGNNAPEKRELVTLSVERRVNYVMRVVIGPARSDNRCLSAGVGAALPGPVTHHQTNARMSVNKMLY